MNDTFFRAEPTKLAFVRQLPREVDKRFGDGSKSASDDELRQMFKRHYTEFGAPAKCEGKAVTLECAIGREDAICGGVIRVFIDCVGADPIS
jgi:hypothetical protein